MKVTRYNQSCLLIEDNGARILIDPSGQEKERLGEFGQLDAVLYTHEHSDHFEAEMAAGFAKQGITVYANASTAKKIDGDKTEVSDGQELDIKGLKIKVIQLPHCLMPNGSEGPQNVGYLINEKLFHPGDGKELADFSVDYLALPITGPDVSMKDSFMFAKQVSAKDVIPIHYDKIGANPDVYATFAGFFPDEFKYKFHVLAEGQSLDI
ncbi:MAG TPA: MBL fold metallo-hydrolase [Candidatus Saccharimonadales bacterium]|nr:MBL fold metallo-hydrolase [Candidatus Saccharimonadales bacterium]